MAFQLGQEAPRVRCLPDLLPTISFARQAEANSELPQAEPLEVPGKRGSERGRGLPEVTQVSDT